MVVAALVAVLVSGSVDVLPVDRTPTDFTSTPRSARLLADSDALGAPSRAESAGAMLAQAYDGGASQRINDLNSKIAFLDMNRPGVGWPIAGVVVGSLLALPGVILILAGVVGLGSGATLGTAGVVAGAILTGLGGVLLIGGIILIVVGANGFGRVAAENMEIDGQINGLKQERRQLEQQLGRPSSSMRDWAPSTLMTVAQF